MASAAAGKPPPPRIMDILPEQRESDCYSASTLQAVQSRVANGALACQGTGRIYWGMPSVVCKAIASDTKSAFGSGTPWLLRKSRAGKAQVMK